MDELWLPIDYFAEGSYLISNKGNVRSTDTLRYSNRYPNGKLFKGKLLKTTINNQGYLNVQLWWNGKYKCFKVHRLVAKAFIPNPQNKPQVNHKDGNKQNNSVDNLEWCTNGENGKHAWDNGLRTKKVGKNNPFSKKVDQYTLNGEFIKTWDSIGEITRVLNISHSLITAACSGKQKTSHGYIWSYSKKGEI